MKKESRLNQEIGNGSSGSNIEPSGNFFRLIYRLRLVGLRPTIPHRTSLHDFYRNGLQPLPKALR